VAALGNYAWRHDAKRLIELYKEVTATIE